VDGDDARIRTVNGVTRRAIGGAATIAYVLPGGVLRRWGDTHNSFSDGWRLIERPGGWLGIPADHVAEMRNRCEVEISIDGYEAARVVITGWKQWTEVLLTPRSAK
jgi:hypothetical protein